MEAFGGDDVPRCGWTVALHRVLGVVLRRAGQHAHTSRSLLPERHSADSGRVARIIISSTVLAFVSFSTLAWLFVLRPAG